MSSSSSPPDEAVGTLLVHQQDLKELSQASSLLPTSSAAARQKEKAVPDEAVGTLLVHQTDLQELSNAAAAPTKIVGMPDSMHHYYLQEREAVGTLLVEPADLKSTPEQQEKVANIRRKITESFNRPAPEGGDDEPTQEDEWAYRDI